MTTLSDIKKAAEASLEIAEIANFGETALLARIIIRQSQTVLKLCAALLVCKEQRNFYMSYASNLTVTEKNSEWLNCNKQIESILKEEGK